MVEQRELIDAMGQKFPSTALLVGSAVDVGTVLANMTNNTVLPINDAAETTLGSVSLTVPSGLPQGAMLQVRVQGYFTLNRAAHPDFAAVAELLVFAGSSPIDPTAFAYASFQQVPLAGVLFEAQSVAQILYMPAAPGALTISWRSTDLSRAPPFGFGLVNRQIAIALAPGP